MSLLTDPAFLVYQLRVSFLRANDPTGERVLTFDDLSVPLSPGALRARQGSTPSPMTPQSRRKTSASEIRQQVAQNTAANAYIMACGHYPETDTVHSPEIEYDEGYMYSRPAPRLAYTAGAARSHDTAPTPNARYPDRQGAPGRNKRTNRNAKIAPTGEGREEVVGLGVVPSHPEMILSAYEGATAGQPAPPLRRSIDMLRHRPLPVVEEVVDSGSLSDSAQPPDPPPKHWQPEPMPPRRSLDTIHHTDRGAGATRAQPAARGDRRRHMGHAYSNSIATIRLQQRPNELLRKGSSRDAIALGIDFDVKSIFEADERNPATDHAFTQLQQPTPGADANDDEKQQQEQQRHERQPSGSKSSTDGRSSQERSHDEKSADTSARLGLKLKQRHQTGPLHSRKKSSASIELRGRRNETSFKIPLANLRDDRSAGSTLLKRSATLPTKRAGASNYNANASAHSGAAATAANQKSRWVGGYADETKPAARRVSGWGSRARDTGWDHSSDDDDDVTPLSRRGAGTQTWYGPREGIRPISMFPPARANAAYPIPPVPLMFGADDSDDDIDLEGDEGSSRTPAALGLGLARGLRTYAGSPNPSIRSRQDSVSTLMDRSRNLRFVPKPSALATSVPLSSPLTVVQTPLAVSGGKYDHLAQEAGSASRPRGISDPEGRQSSRSSHIQSSNRSSWRPAGETASSRPGSKDDSLQQPPAIDGKAGPLRPSSGSEPLSARGFSVATGGGSGAVAGKAANMAAYVPPSAPKSSGLAALLATKMVVRQNPFSEEFGAMGGAAADTNLVELNIFLQYNDKKSQPRSIRVRKAATVEQAIGFALYQHVEDDLEPKLEGSEQDVVMWALRIAMDGEIDDDFPAFDRSRPVANFAFDEFALCLATPDQVKVNEGLRVRHGRPPRMLRPKSLMPPTPSTNPTATALAAETDSEKNSAELLFTITPRVETSAMVLQPSRIATASTAGIFVGTSVLQNQGTQEAHSLSAAAEESSVSQPPQSRLLRVRVLGETSSADALRATTIEADANATIRIVLAQVCRKKQLIEDQYVLGVFDNSGFVVCSSDMAVSQIPSGIEMYLHRVGAALPTLGQVPQPPEAPIYGQQLLQKQQLAIEDPVDAVLVAESSAIGLASAYYTFRVIRRAQMFTRHERSLVIDGETITLMPFDHGTESAKTLTFHISNVICKRNQKSPKKIRLFITRRGNTGEKSIDLEAVSEEDAASICGILIRLRDHYGQAGRV